MTRELKLRRGAADRDPMFAPVWYDGAEMIARPAEEPAPLPEQLVLPIPTPEVLAWQRILDLAGEVTAQLRDEKDFDGYLLAAVANSMVYLDPTAEDIIAAYRRRKAERSNG
jgi:hypothetical protein